MFWSVSLPISRQSGLTFTWINLSKIYLQYLIKNCSKVQFGFVTHGLTTKQFFVSSFRVFRSSAFKGKESLFFYICWIHFALKLRELAVVCCYSCVFSQGTASFDLAKKGVIPLKNVAGLAFEITYRRNDPTLVGHVSLLRELILSRTWDLSMICHKRSR